MKPKAVPLNLTHIVTYVTGDWLHLLQNVSNVSLLGIASFWGIILQEHFKNLKMILILY